MAFNRNHLATSCALALWAVSSLPVASAALSWDICETDEEGNKTCRSRIPKSARIAIAVCCLIVLLLLIALVVCVVKNRRAAKASEAEMNVEASQVEGPATIIATEYNPTSGQPSGVYGVAGNGPRSGLPTGGPKSGLPMSPKSGHLPPMSPQMTGPSVPVAAHYYNRRDSSGTLSSQTGSHAPPNYTAPMGQTTFDQPYPFSYSPRNGSAAQNPPKTAFVTGGFPRPLLAGNRLKDRLKERPQSVASFDYNAPASPSR